MNTGRRASRAWRSPERASRTSHPSGASSLLIAVSARDLLGVRVPSCFPVERYGELHGFFEVSWIDENVLSLDHDLSALSEERCEDIHDGNLVGIELSNEASGSQLNAEHRGIRCGFRKFGTAAQEKCGPPCPD